MARRLVAERCLYGVDLNPLAVELAKLSLWLTTLSKGRPFDFLDHHLESRRQPARPPRPPAAHQATDEAGGSASVSALRAEH